MADVVSLVTAAVVAQVLNIRVSTVYDGVARGRIPAIRLWQGRRRPLLRFRLKDIEDLITERSTRSPNEPKSA